jgi:hypothetical protein
MTILKLERKLKVKLSVPSLKFPVYYPSAYFREPK